LTNKISTPENLSCGQVSYTCIATSIGKQEIGEKPTEMLIRIKPIQFLSFLSPESKNSRSVEKTSVNHNINHELLTTDGRTERTHRQFFTIACSINLFVRPKLSCRVDHYRDIGQFLDKNRNVSFSVNINTPCDPNYIRSRTYPSSGGRNRREVTQGEGYARAVTRRVGPQGSDHIPGVECC